MEDGKASTRTMNNNPAPEPDGKNADNQD